MPTSSAASCFLSKTHCIDRESSFFLPPLPGCQKYVVIYFIVLLALPGTTLPKICNCILFLQAYTCFQRKYLSCEITADRTSAARQNGFENKYIQLCTGMQAKTTPHTRRRSFTHLSDDSLNIVKQYQDHHNHKHYKSGKMDHTFFFGGQRFSDDNLCKKEYQSSAIQCGKR